MSAALALYQPISAQRKTGAAWNNQICCVQVDDGTQRKPLNLQAIDHQRLARSIEAGHKLLFGSTIEKSQRASEIEHRM